MDGQGGGGLVWLTDPMERERTLRPPPALLLIAAFVLLAGIAQLALYPPSPEFNWENRWWQIAVSVARGEGYVACKEIYFPFCGPGNQVTAMREPLPVLLFALIALLTDESLLAAAASGVLVNVAVVAATYFLGRELADTRTGLLAALLWALYLVPVRVFYSQPSGDLPAALAITCGLLYFLRARRTGRPTEWVAAGVWLGLAMLSRSAALAVALVLTVGSLPRRRPAALFAAAWLLTTAPWYVRNHLAFDRPVIGSTLSGYYLYRQNHILPSDDYLRFVTGGEFVPVLREMIARRPDLRGTENEAAMDRVYREEGLRVIAAEPLRYLVLSAHRFLMLWFNWGVREAYRQRNSPGDYLTMIQHGLLLVGAVVGLRGRWRVAWPLAATAAAWSLLFMGVMAHLAYVGSIVPLLVVLTAAACTSLVPRGGRLRAADPIISP